MGVALSRWSVSGGSSSAADKWNSEQSLLPGFFFEVPAEVPISDRFALLTGLGFIHKGFQIGGGQEQYRTGYLQVPLSLGVRVHKGRFRFSPSLGAAFAANMRGNFRYDYGNDNDNWGNLPIGRVGDLGFSFQLPVYEVSLLARVAMSYQLERSSIGIDVGYQYGLSNAMIRYVDVLADFYYPEGNSDPAVPDKAFQRTLTVSLGYSLWLGKMEPTAKDSASIAEANKPARISIGQRLGAASASMRFHASLPEEQERVADGAKPLWGVTTAMVVSVRLNDHFSLQPEVAYTQRGWRCQWYPRPTVRNDLLRMNYVELPLLVRYALGHGKLKPFAIAGPVLGSGIGGHDIVYRGPLANGEEFAYSWPVSFGDDPNDGQYAKFDVAYLVGVGVSWKRDRSEIFLDVRYQSSTTDFVIDHNPLLYSTEVTAQHRVWLLSAGYLIPW